MLRIFGRSTVRIQESCRTMQRPWTSWLQFTGVTSRKRGCIGVERLCWSTSGEGWRNALRKTKEDSKGKLYIFYGKFKEITWKQNGYREYLSSPLLLIQQNRIKDTNTHPIFSLQYWCVVYTNQMFPVLGHCFYAIQYRSIVNTCTPLMLIIL